jgi:hypothetical protein
LAWRKRRIFSFPSAYSQELQASFWEALFLPSWNCVNIPEHNDPRQPNGEMISRYCNRVPQPRQHCAPDPSFRLRTFLLPGSSAALPLGTHVQYLPQQTKVVHECSHVLHELGMSVAKAHRTHSTKHTILPSFLQCSSYVTQDASGSHKI